MAKGEKLFIEHYEPRLVEHGIDNVVLRTYQHIRGFATDDPENSTELVFTPRTEVDGRLNEISEIFGQDRGIAITSIVSHKNEPRNLLLIDCGVASSERCDDQLIPILIRAARQQLPALAGGMLLRTLNSYHIVGFKPLTRDEWIRHMAQAILLETDEGTPICDIRYMGHSLERGYGSLRISDYLGKPTPDFICTI